MLKVSVDLDELVSSPQGIGALLNVPEMERRQVVMERIFGLEWLNEERNRVYLRKKPHVIAQSYQEAKSYILRRKAVGADIPMNPVVTDMLNSYFNLAREVESVETCNGWSDNSFEILQRLKHTDQYKGARFEVKVASAWLYGAHQVGFVARGNHRTSDILVSTDDGWDFAVECKSKQGFSPDYHSDEHYLRIRENVTSHISHYLHERFPDRHILAGFIHFGNLRQEIAPALASEMEQRLRRGISGFDVLWGIECAIHVQDVTPSESSSTMPSAAMVFSGGFLATQIKEVIGSLKKARGQSASAASLAGTPAIICVEVDARFVPNEGIPNYLGMIRQSMTAYFDRYQKDWKQVSGIHLVTEAKMLRHLYKGIMAVTPYTGAIFLRNPYADFAMPAYFPLDEIEDYNSPFRTIAATNSLWNRAGLDGAGIVEGENAG